MDKHKADNTGRQRGKLATKTQQANKKLSWKRKLLMGTLAGGLFGCLLGYVLLLPSKSATASTDTSVTEADREDGASSQVSQSSQPSQPSQPSHSASLNTDKTKQPPNVSVPSTQSTVHRTMTEDTSASLQDPQAQCFTDVNKAYDYLMTQQNAQSSSHGQAMQDTRVNINTASEAELASLIGIGSNKAQAVILYREGFGDFRSVDELANVKGIGKKTVDKNRSRLTVD